MGKVKVTPPTGKGFSNIPNPQRMIANLEKRMAKQEKELDKRGAELKDRDREAEANLLQIQKNKEANLKQINIEPSVYSTKMDAMTKNLGIESRNAQAEMRKALQPTGLEELLEHAPTAVTLLQKKSQKDWQATMEDSYSYHMTHGITEEQKLRLELIEDSNYEQGKGFDLIADKLQEEGYQPKEVQWVRFKNKAADYGRLKAYANLALKDLVSNARDEMIKRGITDPAAMKAFMKDYEIEYLKAHNLYDPEKRKAISAEFMSKGLEHVADQKLQLFNMAENRVAHDIANQRVIGDKLIVQEALNGEKVIDYDIAGQAINNLYANHKRRWNANNTIFTAQQARDAVIKDLEDVTLFPNDAHVELALRTAQGKDNFYTQQIPELLKKRQANRDAIKANVEAAEEVRFTSDTNDLKAYLNPTADDIKNGTGYDGSHASAKAAIEAVVQRHPSRAKDIQDMFGHYLENTPLGRQDGDAITGHYNYLRDNYLLTSEDLNAHDAPPEYKTVSMRMEIARQEKLWEIADIDKRVKPGYEKALRAALVGDDLDKGLDDSYELARDHALARFRAEFAKTEDFQASYDKILLEIKEKRGDFEVTAHGQRGNKDAGTYFESFSPRSQKNAKRHVQDFTTLTAEESDNAVAVVDNENHMIYNRLFIKPKQLEEISNAIYLGKRYNYPPICKRISDLNPEYFGSQADVFKAQVELARDLGFLSEQYDKETGKMNRLSLPMKDFAKTWHRRTDDPFAKKFIQTLSTKDDVRKAITITERPESKSEPQFQSEFVSEQTTMQPIDPINKFDESEYQFEVGTIKEVNDLIQKSNGDVSKDEVSWGTDDSFVWITGDSNEFMKAKGDGHGWKHYPGKGWYKPEQIRYNEEDLVNFYNFNIRDEL